MRSKPEPTRAEDLIADRELADRRADRFDDTRKLAAQDPLPWPPDARDELADEGDQQAAAPVGLASRAVRPRDSRSVDLDEDFVVLGYGPLDLFDSQDLRRPVPVVDDRSQCR